MPAPEFQIIAGLLTVVNGLQVQVTAQGEAIAKLEEINKELSARLNTNNRDSSKPSSTDGYANPSAKAHDSDPTSKSDPKNDKLFEQTARRAQAEEAAYMERVHQRQGCGKVKNISGSPIGLPGSPPLPQRKGLTVRQKEAGGFRFACEIQPVNHPERSLLPVLEW